MNIRYRRRENQYILMEIQFCLDEWSTMMEWLAEVHMRGHSATEQDWLEWGHTKPHEWIGISQSEQFALEDEFEDVNKFDDYFDEFEYYDTKWEDELVLNIQSEDRQYA